MVLSNELISEFVKLANDKPDKNNGNTELLGTIVTQGNTNYVKIDGSSTLTPITSTISVKSGDRVIVSIKNHTATVTGSTTSPSASEVELIVVKDKVVANEATIGELNASNVEITGKLTATEADIEKLKTDKLDASIADIKFATIENLNATNADIHNLKADYGDFKDLSTDKFTAIDADIKKLDTEKLSAEDADIKYANIDFANINMAAIEKLFTDSGIIKDLVVGEGHITGELVGVTIKGDLIEGNTIKADKLVVKGSDGLYYKLNVSGETIESQQTEYNSLDGSVITAKSITATKISVDDLVAFDATIGGFNMTKTSIYSGVKESVHDSTRGIYLDKEGQMNIGDSKNFFKYYRDENGNYRLEISAKSIIFSSSGKDIEESINESIKSQEEQFYQSTSPTVLVGGEWSSSQPVWTEGTFIWRRTKVVYGNGNGEYLPSSDGVCITGNTGAQGEQGASLTNGKSLYRDVFFNQNTNGLSVYNNSSNTNVSITRQAKSSDNPYKEAVYEIMVKTIGTASPGLGGVVQRIDSRANAVFIRRIIAKIPTGYSIKQAENSMGTGYKIEWLTSRAGTGRFTEYIYRYTCGASGSFSNGGHMYIEGAAATSDKPVTWYIASCETYDMLDKNITNFMNFDDSGLVIGDNTKGTLGKNVLIDSDSVDIRNGNTILASFSASRIDLGKNNVNAIIGLCDNKGTIEVVDYTEYQALELRSEFTEIVGEQQVRICSPSSAGACIYVEDYNILLLNRPGFDDGTGKTFESSIGLTDNGIYISMNDDKSVSQLSIKSTIIEANKQIKAPDLYGTNKVLANSGFQTGGCVDTFKNNILWSGSAMWPNASQTANFSQTVSKQPHGIVLVFRGYNSGVQNGDWHSFFVSKHEVAKHGGQGHCFFLSHTPSIMFATKYIYISDNRLKGHDNNSKSETTSEGITYRNNRYVLQYVLGV